MQTMAKILPVNERRRTLQQGVSPTMEGDRVSKKRLFIFDEQSRYIIENTGSAKLTKPNKANLMSQVIESK